MTAGVVEGPQPVPGIARDDHALRADPREEVIARTRQFLGPAYADPVAVPYRVEFPLVLRRVVVPATGQCRYDTVQRGHRLVGMRH